MTHHISLPHFLGESNSSLIREVPPGPDAGAEDSNRDPAPHQRPLEHRFGPNPPLHVGGLPAAMHGQVSSPISRNGVEGANDISNRGTCP